MELQVAAAVLLGGVSIFGGRGAIHGVIGGVLLIGVLASALRLANVTSDVINIITGYCWCSRWSPQAILTWCRASAPSLEEYRETERSSIPATAGTTNERNHMKFGNKLRTVAVAAVSLVFAAAGCGGGGDSGGGGRSGRRGLRSAGTNLAITFLPKNLGNPYFVSAKGGEAVKEFGGTFAEVPTGEATPDAQVSYINTLTQQQVGAIVISANDKRLCVMP